MTTTANITIGKWHILKKDNQFKLIIQSNGNEAGNFLPAHFVDNELPKLFEEVMKHQDLKHKSLTQDKSKHTTSTRAKSKTPLRKLTNPRTSALQTFKCNKCEFTTNINSQLMKHKKTQHDTKPSATHNHHEEEPCPPVNLRFHCMFCCKGFTEETHLTLHEKEVHEIQCELCDSMFYTDDI